MFNPHERFQPRLVKAFQQAKKYYLVSQTFQRGRDVIKDESKEYLLLSHYDDKGHALIHKNALPHDKFAAILDLQNEAHVKKLNEMLQPDSKYIVFSSLISDADKVERTMNQLYEVNIKTWIRTKSNWRIPANYTIHPKLELIFGELFVHMGFGSQKVRLKLADLEKI
ncbi:MAG TPA: hypothetical protein PKM63_21140 [Panacibacter sp.]|nr:hypothetical protein [Panacibacter sp.]HNP46817.1 hypothetical protein [Panacibacter sp.]